MNVSLARLPFQFNKLGAETFGLGFQDRLILQSNCYQQKYQFPGTPKDLRFRQIVQGTSNAIGRCQPDFLLTIDETLIRGLLQLRENIRTTDKNLNENTLRTSDLLEKSFVQDSSLYQRQNSQEKAANAGFPVPRSTIATSEADLLEISHQFGYPHYIKVSFAAGGTGIIPINEPTRADFLKTKFAALGYQLSNTQNAMVQAHAEGEELTVSFAAWKGELLGYTVVRPLQKLFKNGPSAVIQNVYRPKWQTPLQKLVKSLGLSGFGGLDVFETDVTQLPEVIEVNLRATHTTPSSKILGNDLVALFYDALTGANKQPKKIQHVDKDLSIALFPDAIISDPNSEYLRTLPLDITWEDRGITEFLFKQIYKMPKFNR